MDRDCRAKARTSRVLFFAEEGDGPVTREHARDRGTGNSRGKRRERSRSHETSQRPSRQTASPEPMDDDSEPQHTTYCGPLAMADFHRMRHELEALRKEKAVSKKTIAKQSRTIDELRKEVTNLTKSEKERSKEIESMRNQNKKSDEIVANFEATLTCPICTDVLSKPHGLSPCGHVLCQTCLQEWFRSAPVDDDDMYDDEDPPSILDRKKTCPSCRASVLSRPIPLFLVKSLVSDVEKAKTPANTPRRPSPPREDEGDPWADIFREHVHGGWFTDDDEQDRDEDDEDEDEDYDEEDNWSYEGYGSGDDEEHYEGVYVRPRWSPPTVHAVHNDFAFMDDSEDLDIAMLRRGATLQMIDLFGMSYTHDTGLRAIVDINTTVYLGWNIFLHPDDESGEEYMDWITADMYERPERWDFEDDDRGNRTAWKLVPQDDDEEYSTTDSEAWVADLMSD
ncbi:hypothetical protein BKA93DRAFT_727629 [Sparassis latifolia]